MSRPRRGRDLSAIFIHAGAGFHSKDNEKIHLKICENAAKVAMAMLRNGGSAVDAVEIAIMLMEDAEITNAGYGSNPTIHGIVECDATIINHQGRSGAVGAVPQVKNPISLARVLLDSSTTPLTLSRVPPNFLVGPGATDYAYEKGLVVLPHDGLISDGAKQRWHRWQRDLEAAEREKQMTSQGQTPHHSEYYRRPVNVHPAQMLATPSSIQPASSPSATSSSPLAAVASPAITIDTIPTSSQGIATADDKYVDGAFQKKMASGINSPTTLLPNPLMGSVLPNPAIYSTSTPSRHTECNCREGRAVYDPTEDQISDTVGAIAVDSYGNIAAGSSSGGIGLKHQGRIGPAALFGVGTYVIPADSGDPEKTCVATVTSGTGEHIATTLAASTCASRVYYSQRKHNDGTFEDVTEDEAMKEMIATDFMKHPAVKGSHYTGAIGIMTVKKTVDGVALFFAHNTDSFALASMSSADKKPVSVMSRSNGNGSIAQGGRLYRFKRS